ncbi:hypothetical protein NQ315_015979 [Exocentrus adspersus]|uniref:Uncharacterized protein n=1 Tax=Exocentrus adspersus TaxID=1586481 RepID=A0AAV8VMD6_9CUCU|nr:hypothetical protein NQ315_015979 [Exocentrus adspersus]
MASNSSSTSRSRPLSFLSRIPLDDLRLIRVAVRRNHITTSASPGPIERSIEDPKQLIPLVHLRKGKIQYTLLGVFKQFTEEGR